MLKLTKISFVQLFAAITVFAAASASASDLISQYDTNGDGQLSKAEVEASNDSNLVAAFDKLDTNGDGQLSAGELGGF